MTRLGWAVATATLFGALAAAAQNLTKDEEGRQAVGMCYSGCMQRYHDLTVSALARLDRLNDLLISDEYFALTDESQDEVVATELQAFCLLAVANIREMDTCATGCLDVEMAYGTKTSAARSRFHFAFRQERSPLVAAGLWVNYNRSPTGEGFRQACDAYWTAAAETAAVESDTPLVVRVHETAKVAVPETAKSPYKRRTASTKDQSQ